MVGAARWRSTGSAERRQEQAVSGKLIVCPTPIGNLEDITLRVLAALREADLIACEDTRRTRALLKSYGVSGKLVSYHEQNEKARSAELVKRMHDGEVVALVSDAGMPLVSDPGFVLVRACVAAGLAVEVLPGPSAALAALVASALPADRWRFAGFLPRKRAELEAGVRHAGDAGRVRVAAAGGGVAGGAGRARPERPVAVCRELTKLHEEVVRGAAAELAARYAQAPPRGEVVLVVGAAPARERTRTSGRRSRPCASSSIRGQAAGGRAASWPSSPVRAPTSSTRRSPPDVTKGTCRTYMEATAAVRGCRP